LLLQELLLKTFVTGDYMEVKAMKSMPCRVALK